MKKIVNATAPIRICDLGGWSDTWFAHHGLVLNIGVSPYVHCQLEVSDAEDGEGRVSLNAENFGTRYTIDPKATSFGPHPLLEACVAAMRIPKGVDVDISLHSSVPSGSSTGTSAAVSVALIGALDRLTPGRLTPHEAAAKAHQVETDFLHQQSGIQDQLCSAYGGINFIKMHQYPSSVVSQVVLPEELLWELEERMSLIFLGKPHSSSKVHEAVIRELTMAGDDGGAKLDALRKQAEVGRDALFAGDLEAFGKAMCANTDAQANLHPALVCEKAAKLFDIARKYGAVGWKVNGAGGDGGSVSILSGASRYKQREMLAEISQVGDGVSIIDVRFSRYGLRVWER